MEAGARAGASSRIRCFLTAKIHDLAGGVGSDFQTAFSHYRDDDDDNIDDNDDEDGDGDDDDDDDDDDDECVFVCVHA